MLTPHPDGSIYYSIRNFPSYGRLSHLHLEELKPCASDRLLADEYDKENIADFVFGKPMFPSVMAKFFGKVLLEREGLDGILNALQWRWTF